MPEVMTMIQTSRLTPAPSVVTITVLAMTYLLAVTDIAVLMNYVGFATWLSIGRIKETKLDRGAFTLQLFMFWSPKSDNRINPKKCDMCKKKFLSSCVSSTSIERPIKHSLSKNKFSF